MISQNEYYNTKIVIHRQALNIYLAFSMKSGVIHNEWIKLCILSTATTIYCICSRKMYKNGICKGAKATKQFTQQSK